MKLKIKILKNKRKFHSPSRIECRIIFLKKGNKTKMMIIIKMRSWILPDKHSFFFLLRVIKDV